MNREKKQLLVFGYGLSVILAFIFFKLWRVHGLGVIHIALMSAIVVLVFLTSSRLDLLMPFYKQWMRIAHGIGNVVMQAVLAGVFYLLFGSVGIILRLLKKDLLDQKINPGAQSYWIKKDKKIFDKQHYTQQF